MKNTVLKVAFMATVATLLPALTYAQGVAADLQSLQGVLNNLYTQMIPLCSQLIGVGQAVAGFAALFFIAVRVWRHIAAAEPIDFYPLLRPFVIGFCILSFTSVLAMINGVLQPIVTATQAMAGNANTAVMNMTDPSQQDNANTSGSPLNSNPDKYYQYSHPENQASPNTTSTNMTDQFSGWGLKNMFRKWLAELLNVCFEAAALVIDTIRTFKLIVLAILGPLCFGLSVFDGFQHTLKQWLARYINVYMWLPVANIFGAIISKIQQNMIQLEQSGGAASPHFSDTNTAYLIFMMIGIVGYFTVPSIASYIINTGGHALLNKTSSLASSAISYTGGAMSQGLFSMGKNSGVNTKPGGGDAAAHNSHLADKISGKS